MQYFGALILDAGGVLIETPTRDARSAWERAHGLEQGQLDRLFVEAVGPGWEGGRSEAEIEAKLCKACGIGPSGLTELLGALSADERVCSQWRLLLDAVAGTLPLALLTNSGPNTRTGLVARHGLERWFSVIVISAEEGLSKPDPQIYRRTCERLGRRPAECLFVDDRPSNIAGAEAAGTRRRPLRFFSRDNPGCPSAPWPWAPPLGSPPTQRSSRRIASAWRGLAEHGRALQGRVDRAFQDRAQRAEAKSASLPGPSAVTFAARLRIDRQQRRPARRSARAPARWRPGVKDRTEPLRTRRATASSRALPTQCSSLGGKLTKPPAQSRQCI